jgi:post-segregation antitoxin (ccd killing protein)
MVTKVNTCIYLDRKVLETAKQMGLNVSRVSENALVEAVGRLEGPERETGLRRPLQFCARGKA